MNFLVLTTPRQLDHSTQQQQKHGKAAHNGTITQQHHGITASPHHGNAAMRQYPATQKHVNKETL